MSEENTAAASEWVYMNDSLGFQFPVRFSFHTPEEYDAQAGRKNAWREDLAAGACYGAPNTRFRDALGKALAEYLGEPQPLDDDKSTAEKPVPLDTKRYLAAIRAENRIDEASLNTIAQEVASKLPPAKIASGRSGSPKIPKEVLAKASNVLANCVSAGDTDGTQWIAGIESKVPGIWAGGEFNEENIAKTIQAYLNWQLKNTEF